MDTAKTEASHARGARIRQIRNQFLRMTRRQLCDKTDISTATIRAWEMGFSSGLTEKGARKLVSRFHDLDLLCSTAWLLHGIGSDPCFASETTTFDPKEDNQIAEEVLLFKHSQPDALVFKGEDESMAPLLYPEGYAAGLPLKQVKNGLGKFCILTLENGERCLRLLQKGKEANEYCLKALHKDFPEISVTKIRSAAPILWVRNRHRMIMSPLRTTAAAANQAQK